MPCTNCDCGKAKAQDALKKCDTEYQEWLEELENKGITLKEVPKIKDIGFKIDMMDYYMKGYER